MQGWHSVSENMDTTLQDCIIIGAGYGGLAAAALLAKHGLSCTLLEAHTAVGGCASFFRRMRYHFDAGATTLSGTLPHQPLGRLFSSLNIKPELKHLDPGMGIYLDGAMIMRPSDKYEWIQEAGRHFGSKGQKSFWEEIYSIDATVWQLLAENPELPPRTISEWLRMGLRPGNLKGLKLLPGLIRPLDILLERHKLSDNKQFRRFINEQLLISTQSFSDTAPIITAAMGLAYPSETYYPVGGIVRPAQLIADAFRQAGGSLIMKEQVVQISMNNGIYNVRTQKGNEYIAKRLISNIPVWNLPQIAQDTPIADYTKRLAGQFSSAWGAFTAYFAVQGILDIPTAYFQVHTRSTIPLCKGDSFFITFSMPGDTKKAPEGWHTITISTHTQAEQWWNMSIEEYEEQKKRTLEFILNELKFAFPQLEHMPMEYIDAGTPRTFHHYTGRHMGYVGGIPHASDLSFLRLPPNITPIKGFYMTGDTAFPGQGTPAVVMGAQNAVRHILGDA